MNKLILLLVLLLSSCQMPSLPAVLAPRPTRNTYYVAPNGNDNYPGTLDQPWKTIQNAANFGGGTIYISAGAFQNA